MYCVGQGSEQIIIMTEGRKADKTFFHSVEIIQEGNILPCVLESEMFWLDYI